MVTKTWLDNQFQVGEDVKAPQLGEMFRAGTVLFVDWNGGEQRCFVEWSNGRRTWESANLLTALEVAS